MPTAVINQSDCRVHLAGERLQVYGRNPAADRDEVLREIPLRDLDRLIISESVHLTTPALAAVLRAGVAVQVFAWSGSFLGSFLPAQHKHGLARLQQYRRTLEPAFALQMAGRIVTAKLYNQRRVLQRLQASRVEGRESSAGNDAPAAEARDAHSSPLDSTLKWLDALFASLRTSQTIDELRGYEGTSTARYFQAWASFLPEEFPFERRSTRPPLNPVNACISFGSTLLYNEAAAFLHAHGLDPALGTLHATEDGRWSLAPDLIEPFRPVLVEALALDLFSHQILKAGSFEPRHGGVYLSTDDKRLHKVARICENYGVRVQYSVFECHLDEDEFADFWLNLLEVINEEEDRLVAYKIDARSAKETLTAGTMTCSEKVVCYLV